MSPCPSFEGYEIIRKLGGGSMGVVYLAVRYDTGQQVAIKVVSGGKTLEEEEKITFERDGADLQQRIAQADPEHIVGVNRFLLHDGDLIIEMEYVPGDNLGEVIRNGRSLPPQRAARIALEMVRMLDNLDSLKPPVVHGDLKPGNVIVKGDANIKVVDFGIAKQLSNGCGTFNQFQSIPYSSPERLRTGDVDLQSDLWAVAVMLYEMTSGHHPFYAPMAMLRARTLDGRGPDPLPSSCPHALACIIHKALATSPADRYPSAKDLSDDLERFLNGQPVTAKAPDPDATVRTPRPAQPNQHRTPPSSVPPRYSPPAPIPSSPRHMLHSQITQAAQFITKHRADVRLFAAGLFLLALILAGHRQYEIGKTGSELRSALLSGQISLDDAWTKFSPLHKSAWVPFLLWGLQDTLRSKLLDEGSEPIMDYRQDQPTATLADWERSQEDLRRLVQIDPRNKIAKGREQICEGQLARFHARTLVHGRVTFNARLLSQSLEHFQQAAELMPDSPDPYLAMAPVYLYYELDYDRGMAMQEAALKRGHTKGKRETAQLADSLKANARHEMTLAQQLDDPANVKKHLQNSVSAFESAIVYYGQIAGFASSSQGLREAIQGRQQAQKMLDQMQTRNP